MRLLLRRCTCGSSGFSIAIKAHVVLTTDGPALNCQPKAAMRHS
jgi:hypothetical protein